MTKTLKYQVRYEANLSGVSKSSSVQIVCRMIAYWYNDGEKVNQPDTGEVKTALIKAPKFKLKINELTFNTVQGKIDSDAFDIQETFKGKNITTPEFKDGKEQQGTMVAYPLHSKPAITTVAELSSDDIPAEQWKSLNVKLSSKGGNSETNLIKGKEFLTQGTMELTEGPGANTHTVRGAVLSEKPLEKEMKQGCLQFTWSASLEDGQLDCSAETTITNAFLLLRQKEIGAGEHTPKLWKQALLAGVGHLLKKADNKTALSRVTNNQEYAAALVKGIIYHSVYTSDPDKPNYSIQQNGHYTVKVSSILQGYSGSTYPALICVESAGTLDALFHLMTNDTIATRRANPVPKPGIPLPAKTIGHAFNMLNGKVYDGVPFLSTEQPIVHTDNAIPSIQSCGGDVQKRLDELMKNEKYNLQFDEDPASVTIE